MNYFVFSIIFIIVLFFYLHIHFQLKTSNENEIYFVEKPDVIKLQELCNLKQPFVFQENDETINTTFNTDILLSKYSQDMVNVRNLVEEDKTINDTYDLNEKNESIHLTINDYVELLNSGNTFISNENKLFLIKTKLNELLRKKILFQPSMKWNEEYDIILGNKTSFTPLQYNLSERNFFYLSQGSISVKLIAPSYRCYLDAKKDYYNFKFYSSYNIWNIQDEYKKDYENVKELNITLKKGDVLFIPPYWWYSFQLNKTSLLLSLNYYTFMNYLSIINHTILYYLQQANIKKQNRYNKVKLTEDNVTSTKKKTYNKVKLTEDNNNKEMKIKDKDKEKINKYETTK